MTYAFVFDASSCTGCKACQVACKDKNNLPVGVLWRRVYEVTGGSWQQEGDAWTSTVFTYNLSIACNHCKHAKCAGVCPVDAYSVRPDGLVILDTSKCTGCGYCAWACPYGAPQYDAAAGVMTKCNFCFDNIDAGLAPACVSACPLRALDYVKVEEGAALPAGYDALWETYAETHPFPMANNSRTQPHLAIKPHPGMRSPEEKVLANREEVRPRHAAGWHEAPLVAFTLLMQAAVGGLWALLWLLPGLHPLPLLTVGLCLGAGLLTSFAHLGRKRNAWRVLSHLRKSWLSREILYSLFFGAGWLATLGAALLAIDFPLFGWLAALLGIELVHAMSRVYRLRTVPAWNSWRTEARFFLSAALLGLLTTAPVLAHLHVPDLPLPAIGSLLVLLLSQQLVLETSAPLIPGATSFRVACMLSAMAGIALVFFIPGWFGVYTCLAVLVIVLAEQIVGRWSFYRAHLAA